MANIVVLALLILFCTSANGSLTLEINATTSPSELNPFIAKARSTLEEWYPKIASYLSSENYTAPDLIQLHFEDCEGVASSGNFGGIGKMFLCNKYYLNHPQDLGSVVHVVTFIIQDYNTVPRPPYYITHGIAQYIRKYLYEQNKPDQPLLSQRFNSTDDTAAYFLNYVNEKYPRQPMNVIQLINRDSRIGKFDDEQIWQANFGKSVDQLWDIMMVDDSSLN